jgi:hypothetical protein
MVELLPTWGAVMSGDTITFARPAGGNISLAKRIHVQGGRVTRKDASPNVSMFDYTETTVQDLRSLYVAVKAAAARGDIAIRAKPKGPRGNRRIYPRDGIEPHCEVVPRRWVGVDWDGLPLELQPCPNPRWLWEPDPLLEPWIGARIALRRLPRQFRDASCFWQVSAGAGFNPGFRLRTWHWLDYPVTGADLKVWLKPALDRGIVDAATLVEVQPHYLAVTVKGSADPCPRRFGYLRLARQAVPVPDLHAIKRAQEDAERQKRQAETYRRREAGDHRAAAFLAKHGIEVVIGPAFDAQTRIDDCIAAIRSATARHTTYKHEAARAKALCGKHGIDWQPVRAALKAAYEATLSPTERNQRRSFSTEGVMSWLEARTGA